MPVDPALTPSPAPGPAPDVDPAPDPGSAPEPGSAPDPGSAPAFRPEIAARLPLVQHLDSFAGAPAGTFEEWTADYGPAETWDLMVEDRDLPGPHGRVPVRIYTPEGLVPDGGRPVLVWIHGGSFMHGDLDMPEAEDVARGVAGRADAVVVSVFYRLVDEPATWADAKPAPNPEGDRGVHAPIPLDDVMIAVRWSVDHARELGGDPDRIAVGGASAGGNLAAATALRAPTEGIVLALSLPIYPALHGSLPEPTDEEARALAGVPLPLRFPPPVYQEMSENYLGRPLTEATAFEFPALATREQLATAPPTYLEISEFDDLRVSGDRYAAQLREAGVEVELVLRRGVPHGHLNRRGLEAAGETMDAIAERLRGL